MRIGVPKEIKNHEYRVGLTPDSVRRAGRPRSRGGRRDHAGAGIGASDADYEAAGAKILPTPEEVFDAAQMIVKVKEPQAVERAMLRPDHILFTYLHLAPGRRADRGSGQVGAPASPTRP
jgi:alanine dehydrogenase